MDFYNKLSKSNLFPPYNILKLLGIIWLALLLILISYTKISTFTQLLLDNISCGLLMTRFITNVTFKARLSEISLGLHVRPLSSWTSIAFRSEIFMVSDPYTLNKYFFNQFINYVV